MGVEERNARKLEARRRRREEGLCLLCPTPSTTQYCPFHKEGLNKRRRERREEHLKAGVCRDCGKPSNAYSTCFKCRGGPSSFRFKLRADRSRQSRGKRVESRALSWALLNHRLRFDSSEGGEE